MKLLVLFVLGCLLLAGSAIAATVKPWLWAPQQASSALMRQAEDFYVETTDTGAKLPRDLVTTRCRGTGKAVARRFVSFRCTATVQRGVADSPLNVRVNAKTRRAGGLCWAFPPTPIPSGCFAPGRRGEGSIEDAFRAMVQKVGTFNHDFRCLAHGAGFFACSWMTAEIVHRGTVIFSPAPMVRVLS